MHQVFAFVFIESENQVDFFYISGVKSDGVRSFRGDVFEGHEFIGLLGGPGQFAGSFESQNEEIEDETVELKEEGGEAESVNYTVRLRVVHVFEGNNDIVFGGYVVGDVMVDDKSQQSVQKRQIHFFVHLFQFGLHDNEGLVTRSVPNAAQIVDSLTPFVHQ